MWERVWLQQASRDVGFVTECVVKRKESEKQSPSQVSRK
jgi:hypothetical protein